VLVLLATDIEPSPSVPSPLPEPTPVEIVFSNIFQQFEAQGSEGAKVTEIDLWF
jgi:hypothetical protein